MVLFFYGPNVYASRQKLRELVARFKKSSGSDFGLERIDGSKATADQIVSAITALPFLGGHRLVVVEDMLANKDIVASVIANLNRVPEVNVVVFYERQADQRTKGFKDLVKVTRAKKFEPLEGSRLVQWLRKTAQDKGGSFDSETAQYLIERAGNDQWRLSQEIAKLINYESKVSKDAIKQLVEPVFEQTIFDLIEAVSDGQLKRALELYQGLRNNKAEPLYILSMLGWQLHNLLIVKAAEELPASEIAKDFGMSPFVINKTRRLNGRVDFDTLNLTYDSVIETDFKLKTGGGEPDLLMEQLIINLAQLLSPAMPIYQQ